MPRWHRDGKRVRWFLETVEETLPLTHFLRYPEAQIRKLQTTNITRVVITDNRRPVAVLVEPEEFECMLDAERRGRTVNLSKAYAQALRQF